MSEPKYWMELTPNELDAAIDDTPICYWPIGSLEWHGEHLPLGTDSYRADAVVADAASRTGGVIMPLHYVTAPGFAAYRGTITFSPLLVSRMVDEMIRELHKVGFKVLAVCMAHCGPVQEHCFQRPPGHPALPEDFRCVVSNGMNKEIVEPLEIGRGHAGPIEAVQARYIAPGHAIHIDRYKTGIEPLPRYEGLDPEEYSEGLPENLKADVKRHMNRTEKDWEPSLPDDCAKDDIDRRAVEAAGKELARLADEALKDLMQ